MCIVHRGEGPASLRPTCSCSKEPYFFCERADDAVLFMLTPNLHILRCVTSRCAVIS